MYMWNIAYFWECQINQNKHTHRVKTTGQRGSYVLIYLFKTAMRKKTGKNTRQTTEQKQRVKVAFAYQFFFHNGHASLNPGVSRIRKTSRVYLRASFLTGILVCHF